MKIAAGRVRTHAITMLRMVAICCPEIGAVQPVEWVCHQWIGQMQNRSSDAPNT